MSLNDGKMGIELDAHVAPAEKIITTVISSPAIDPDISECPADGDLRAWSQVVGGFLLWFNLWGYTFAFGSFQNFYNNGHLQSASPSSIAWIGSIQSFLLVLSGVYTGILFDLGYFKSMMFAGAFLSTLGSFMLSLATEYWQIFLTQGVCIGLGCGMLFVPCMALIARSFQRRRALAVGLMSCGAPTGSIIYTFIFEGLITKVGFAWTTRSMAFFMLGSYTLSFPLLLWRAKNTGSITGNGKRKLFDRNALTDLPFWSYTLAVSFQFMAYLTPFFFMPTYGQVALGLSIQKASQVLIISQASSIPGRLGAASAANFVGVMIPWASCALVAGLLCLIWIVAKDSASFTAVAALYGFFSGALIPLPTSILPVVVEDPRVLGTRMGMAQGVSSITSVIGPPIAGALLRSNNGNNWLALQLFSGLVLMFATVQILGLWMLLVKKRNAKVLV